MTVLTRDAAVNLAEKAKKEGRRIVFTNGCFDILHRGHIEYLKAAAQLGDILIVGINTDTSVRKIKGKGRPVMPENDRAAIIAALRCVGAVCLFDEDTPRELIRAIRPDVLVKGAEYAVEDIVGHDQVIEDGGKVVPVPMVHGISTTELIKKIKELPD